MSQKLLVNSDFRYSRIFESIPFEFAEIVPDVQFQCVETNCSIFIVKDLKRNLEPLLKQTQHFNPRIIITYCDSLDLTELAYKHNYSIIITDSDENTRKMLNGAQRYAKKPNDIYTKIKQIDTAELKTELLELMLNKKQVEKILEKNLSIKEIINMNLEQLSEIPNMSVVSARKFCSLARGEKQ
ncbi:Hypothetical_protein [Hexamita inflata]|uniref:Hypothetical_protein n=1 Tax=Hexamita inflata TaxID=28002 RepID=A0AA86RAT8_9EUKA|nr:Hypothetical protein HINF_LOCUS57202 [Hexamita inflata]